MPWTRPTKVELQSLELKSLQLLATADVLLALLSFYSFAPRSKRTIQSLKRWAWYQTVPDKCIQMPDKFVMFHVSYVFQNMSRQRYVDLPDLHTSKRDDLSRPGFRRTLPTSIQHLPTFLEVWWSMRLAFDIVWPLEEEVLRLRDLSVKSLSQIMWVLNVHFAHFTHSAFVGSKTVRRIPPCFRGTAALWGCTARVAARFEQDFKWFWMWIYNSIQSVFVTVRILS